MSFRTGENRRQSLVAVGVFIIIVAAAIAALVFLKGFNKAPEEEYNWITADPAAVNGMLDGTYYKGEKNSAGTLSYKIAEEITVDSAGSGDFRIENSGKNSCLMKVKITVDGKTIYESGYIKPNQHINTDKLDTVLEAGTYNAEARFEGFDPNTEQSLGVTSAVTVITVL